MVSADRSGREQPLTLVLDLIQQGIALYDRFQHLVYFNRRYAEIYGLRVDQLRVGMTLREVVDLRYEAGTGPKMSAAEYRAWLIRLVTMARSTDTEIMMGNGSVYQLHHEPLADGGFVGFVADVTERRLAERRIEHMAHHDSLTGIPNRVQFFDGLDRSIRWLRGDGLLEMDRPPVSANDRLLAVMFLDLDKFKDVNDTLGHLTGDELLQQVAHRIRDCLRQTDMLARLGGDEFAIVIDRGIVDAGQVRAVAQRIVEAIARPFRLDRHEVAVGATIGFTLTDARAPDVSSAALLSQADLALYQAKVHQRGTVCAFESGMDVAFARRTELERDLRRAIAEEAMEVHFQPICQLAPLRILGAEALVRWRHPRHGDLSPGEFIPVAEAAGMIVALGSWVLRRACAQAARWGARAGAPCLGEAPWKEMTIAVNLSPEQVRQPDFVATVRDILLETGLPPGRLELEITEGIFLRDTEATASKLAQLRTLGVGIVLDDFGTGYASLGYLRRYPFSKLKIDRSFIAPMDTDAGTAAIVRAVTALGRSLDMRVVAEGIETESQLDQVRAAGCEEAQGYLFGRPCRAEAFEALRVWAG